MTASKTIQVKLIKSGIGRIKKHKLCIQGLGFKKLNHVVTVEDTPSKPIVMILEGIQLKALAPLEDSMRFDLER